MAATDPVAPEPRRFPIWISRPLWIGVATAFMLMPDRLELEE